MMLSVIMVLALSVPAFAAEHDTVTITINDPMGVMPMADEPLTRSYDAYKLLNLTTSQSGDKVNYAYTLNDKYADILKELVFAENWEESLGDKPDSKDKVTQEQVIAYLGTLTSDIKDDDGAITQIGSIHDFMVKVYKKIKAANPAISADATSSNGQFTDMAQGYWMIVDTTKIEGNDTNSLIIVDTKGQDEITVTPKTSVPTVDKEVQENSTKDWGDSADYNIGDNVPFKLTGTVSEYYDYYETYKFVFHDTLSNGLTLAEGFGVENVTVKVDGVEIESGFTVVTSGLDDGCSFHVVFDDLKDITSVKADSKITVEYTATLTSGAVIGNDGNLNSVHLEYSNNPNDEQGGETGKTPDETVVVFTYELDVDKVDGSSENEGTYSKHLEGAWFVLYRTDAEGEKEYAAINENGKLTGWTSEMPTHQNGDSTANGNLKSGEDGKFEIIGLDAGIYYLEETVAPAGYNLLTKPLKLTITATVSDEATSAEGTKQLTELEVTVDDGEAQEGNVTTGTVSIIVENNSGTELPSTGGMGTTIFYVVGGILVAGAAILLVTKKRMGVSEK
ncbi:MAG: SpaH/EbpB family LPXTG-anchored major pilin [Oscillospiraceae bacterium]